MNHSREIQCLKTFYCRTIHHSSILISLLKLRKVNGEHYPPSKVYQLLSGLHARGKSKLPQLLEQAEHTLSTITTRIGTTMWRGNFEELLFWARNFTGSYWPPTRRRFVGELGEIIILVLYIQCEYSLRVRTQILSHDNNIITTLGPKWALLCLDAVAGSMERKV